MKCLSLSAAGLIVTALHVSAAVSQTNPAAAKETNFLEILARGGIMMYPLGLMSFVNFGRDDASARDGYVYIISHDGPIAHEPATHNQSSTRSRS